MSEPEFKCSKCGQVFRSKQELDAHIKIHERSEVAGVG
ncbi:MAG: C2H2-type zinc finger protein [Nitrososphaerales archaeon]